MLRSSRAAGPATTRPGASSSSASPATSTRSRSQAFRLSQQDAEDVFQEVFARVYERLDRLRDDDAVRPWIAQLTRRVCIDRLALGRAGVDADVDELPEPPADDDAGRARRGVQRARGAGRAPASTASEILDRFFARDESYPRSATTLGLPAGTIASRISRCLGQAARAARGKKRAPRCVWWTGDVMSDYDDEQLSRLIGMRPPAPEAWVQAAQELPAAGAALDAAGRPGRGRRRLPRRAARRSRGARCSPRASSRSPAWSTSSAASLADRLALSDPRR